MGIPITTADTIPGQIVDTLHGPVNDVSVREGKGVRASDISETTEKAIKRMGQRAVEMGANAVIGLRIAASASVIPTVRGYESVDTVIAYGAAVTTRDRSAAEQ